MPKQPKIPEPTLPRLIRWELLDLHGLEVSATTRKLLKSRKYAKEHKFFTKLMVPDRHVPSLSIDPQDFYQWLKWIEGYLKPKEFLFILQFLNTYCTVERNILINWTYHIEGIINAKDPKAKS